MKKIITLTLILSTIFLASCGENDFKIEKGKLSTDEYYNIITKNIDRLNFFVDIYFKDNGFYPKNKEDFIKYIQDHFIINSEFNEFIASLNKIKEQEGCSEGYKYELEFINLEGMKVDGLNTTYKEYYGDKLIYFPNYKITVCEGLSTKKILNKLIDIKDEDRYNWIKNTLNGINDSGKGIFISNSIQDYVNLIYDYEINITNTSKISFILD